MFIVILWKHLCIINAYRHFLYNYRHKNSAKASIETFNLCPAELINLITTNNDNMYRLISSREEKDKKLLKCYLTN